MRQKQPLPLLDLVESLHGVVPLILVAEAVGEKEGQPIRVIEVGSRFERNQELIKYTSRSRHAMGWGVCEDASKGRDRYLCR